MKYIKRLFAALLAIFVLLLSGCSLPKISMAINELYSLPKVADDLKSLQNLLDDLIDDGYEYAPPLYGDNTQSIQMVDVDNDDSNEVVAFLRNTKSTSNRLGIFIFKQNKKGDYEQMYVISGDGIDINSVVFTQLDDDPDGRLEVIVSWQVSNSVYSLSAYSLEQDEPSLLIKINSYTQYCACDMDGDSISELVICKLNADDGYIGVASMYAIVDDEFKLISSVNLSDRFNKLDKPKFGKLTNGLPALYVTGTALDNYNNNTMQIVDILVADEDKKLQNVTIYDHLSYSYITFCHKVSDIKDIDDDGVYEIPVSFYLKSHSKTDTKTFYGISWIHFNSADYDDYDKVATTYYNNTDGWSYYLPLAWVDYITLEESDDSTANLHKSVTCFYYKNVLAFKIYKCTGYNCDKYWSENGHILLYNTSNEYYSLEIVNKISGITDDEDALKKRFELTADIWS